jgi:transposase
MGKPYSMDLRERVVAAIEGGVSTRQAAVQFSIGIATAGTWARLKRATGDVRPAKQGKPKGAVLDAHADFILGVLAEAPDTTLDEMVERLREERAVTVVRTAVWKEAGYVEGKNLLIEYRWGEGQNNRLPALATELVRRRVAVIVSASGTPSVLAAKAATATIQIVFSVGTDPIAFGLVASLNKPGGNLMGVTLLFDEVASKRLELAHELMPATTIIALLVNPTNPNSETQSRDLQEAARKLALQLHTLRASTERDLDAVFATVAQLRADCDTWIVA